MFSDESEEHSDPVFLNTGQFRPEFNQYREESLDILELKSDDEELNLFSFGLPKESEFPNIKIEDNTDILSFEESQIQTQMKQTDSIFTKYHTASTTENSLKLVSTKSEYSSHHQDVLPSSRGRRKKNSKDKRETDRVKQIKKSIPEYDSLNIKQKLKIRNRVSAQQSRDRKKKEFDQIKKERDIIIESNQQLKMELKSKEIELSQYEEIVSKLSPKAREEFMRIKTQVTSIFSKDVQPNPNDQERTTQPSQQNQTLRFGRMARNPIIMTTCILGCLLFCGNLVQPNGSLKIEQPTTVPATFFKSFPSISPNRRMLSSSDIKIKQEDEQAMEDDPSRGPTQFDAM